MEDNKARKTRYTTGPEGDKIPVYDTAVVEQPQSYTQAEHALWSEMFIEQRKVLAGRACQEFLDNMDRCGLDDTGIPRFSDLGSYLQPRTGWTLVGVNGLLPSEDFFGHLSRRHFPVTWWIRDRSEKDYVAEPDVFHDLFGHVPMLANRAVGDYLVEYANACLDVCDNEQMLERLAHLYWFTIEFGLVMQAGVPRIFGAGIASSRTESILAVDPARVRHLPFDPAAAARMPYRIDQPQPSYFVLDRLDDLIVLDRERLLAVAKGGQNN